jgi:hypothetical protein
MVTRSSWVLYCCLALLALFWDSPVAAAEDPGYTGPKKPKKLKIQSTYEPASCYKKGAKKARKGDELTVLYVRLH